MNNDFILLRKYLFDFLLIAPLYLTHPQAISSWNKISYEFKKEQNIVQIQVSNHTPIQRSEPTIQKITYLKGEEEC
jgi:hypothetical protein